MRKRQRKSARAASVKRSVIKFATSRNVLERISYCTGCHTKNYTEIWRNLNSPTNLATFKKCFIIYMRRVHSTGGVAVLVHHVLAEGVATSVRLGAQLALVSSGHSALETQMPAQRAFHRVDATAAKAAELRLVGGVVCFGGGLAEIGNEKKYVLWKWSTIILVVCCGLRLFELCVVWFLWSRMEENNTGTEM